MAGASLNSATNCTVTNPKDLIGQTKPGVRCISPVALLEEGIIMQDGGDKYGPFNWQDAPIQASIYYDAMMRHLLAWYTGQDVDPGSKSGGLHLAAVRAGAGILIDAFATGSIIDDRPKRAASAADAIERLGKQRMEKLTKGGDPCPATGCEKSTARPS